MKSPNVLKVVLAVLLLLCLADMPYGYFVFVRIVAMIGFAILAYQASRMEHNTETIIYVGLAILFQPLIKIALGRPIWNIVDVIVAAGLIISIFRQSRTS
jgi:hypothetical protein